MIGIVHGLFHKSDLSLDAVIKFFAAGFIIATPTAYFFESMVMFGAAFIFYAVDMILDTFTNIDLLDFVETNRSMMLISDILQSFFIAAVIEELCKYYAFRTVEHPDLIFLTGLNRVRRDKRSGFGGNSAYTFSSDNNALISRHDTFDSEFSQRNTTSRPYRGNSVSPQRRRRKNGGADDIDDNDIRTLRQKAAAITTAMISCAVGLACAENFMYVFFLGGSNAQEEMTMLVFRSIFPVHALCAAVQSIGVIQKFLEDPEKIPYRLGVGKIVLPSIILHGSFDAILMTVNSIIDMALEDAENQGGKGGNDFEFLDLIAGVTVIAVMLIGLLWYYIKNRLQKARLKLMEGPTTTNTAARHEDGIELL